jgi:hypothetical protein
MNQDKTCTVPVDNVQYVGGKTTEYKRGIYTGFSEITRKHHFSLFNGETVQLSNLNNVSFDDPNDKEIFISDFE